MTVNDSWEEEIDISFDDLVESSEDATDLVVLEAVAQEIVTPSTFSYDEAQEITERIRSTSDVLYLLISKAHAGKAWAALSYANFEEYVKAEFDISRSRAYQLINQANVVQAIEAAAPEGTQVRITEAAARDLKSVLEELAPQVREATDGRTPEESEDIIAGLVGDYRAEKKAAGEDDDFNPEDLLSEFDGFGESYDEELSGDRADRDGFSASSMGGNMGGGGSGFGGSSFPVETGSEDPDEDLLLESLGTDIPDEDEIDIDEILGIGNDPKGVRRRFEAICNLYLALSSLSKMLPADELAPWVWSQEERRGQVESNLPVSIEWLQSFSAEWEKQKGLEGNTETSDVDPSLEEAYDEEIAN